MADLRLAMTQSHYALLTAIRTPRTVVFSMVFPVVLLIMFDSIFTDGAADTVTFAGGTINASAYFTASLSAYAIGLSTFTSLAVGVTAQRETGQLKRLRGTPMPAWTFVAGQVTRSAVVALIVVVAMLATGVVFFGVHIAAERLVGFVVYFALGAIAFSALGIAATAFTPTVDSASVVGPFIVVMLSFVSGVFISVDQLPNWLEAVGKAFPLYHLAEGLQTSLVSGTGGTGLVAGNVGVLVLWGLAGTVIATRRFRWEPQAAGSGS
jgi:ABC-2 type transport system permease protein